MKLTIKIQQINLQKKFITDYIVSADCKFNRNYNRRQFCIQLNTADLKYNLGKSLLLMLLIQIISKSAQ